MALRSKISDRWKHDEFVAKKTPPSLIHDLMQPLNAYGLAAEQLRIRLSHSLTQEPCLLGDLDAMDSTIREVESMLSLLGAFWRLDSLPLQPVLAPTSLEDVLKAALNCQKKNHPSFQVLITGLDHQWVSSSANWLSTLLSCIFNLLAHGSESQIDVEIMSSERNITVNISGTKPRTSKKIEYDTINTYIAKKIAKKFLIDLKIRKDSEIEYFSISLPSSNKNIKESHEHLSKILTGNRISILDHDRNFSNELKTLLQSWGCTVRIIREINPSKIPLSLENAIFLSLETWEKLFTNSSNTDPCLQFAEKIFITVNRNTHQQKTNNSFISDCRYTFLPRPISPTRLQKTLMSSLISSEKK